VWKSSCLRQQYIYVCKNIDGNRKQTTTSAVVDPWAMDGEGEGAAVTAARLVSFLVVSIALRSDRITQPVRVRMQRHKRKVKRPRSKRAQNVLFLGLQGSS
jgi:hypothetical protein